MSRDGGDPEVYGVATHFKWHAGWKQMLFDKTVARGEGYVLTDNGNGIHIEGPNISIDLDYIQAEAVFRLLSLADRHTAKYHYNGTGWTDAPVIETRLVKRKQKARK
jgi:hypothetical protein